MNNKKADMTFTMILIVLAVASFVILFSINREGLAKTGGSIGNLFDSTGDYDGDGLINQFDKCDCIAGIEQFDGCKEELDETKLKSEMGRCNEEMEKAKNDAKTKN